MSLAAWRRAVRPAVAALQALAACAACPVPPPANPIADGPTMERRLREALDAAGRFRAEASAEQVTERGPVRGRVYVFLGPPDRLRFDSMSPVDTPLAVLVSDGVAFALHDIQANRYYFGPALPCNIARLLRIPLPGEAIVRLLLGLPPPVEAVESSVEWDGGGWYVYRRRTADGTVQTARIAPLGRALDTLSVVSSSPGGVSWSVAFADHRSAGGLRIPWRIRFEAEGAEGPVDMRYVEAETGVDLPDDAWTYPPPPGIPVEEVGCETVIEIVPWVEGDREGR